MDGEEGQQRDELGAIAIIQERDDGGWVVFQESSRGGKKRLDVASVWGYADRTC